MNGSSYNDSLSADCPPPSTGTPWLLVILDILFLIIGFLGNMCLICITLRFKNMRTVPNYLIINLAVADLVFLFLLLPDQIIRDLHTVNIHFITTEFGCKIFQYIKIVFLGVSIFTLTALSIDRYLAVSKPLACRILRGGRHRLYAVLLGITAIWLTAFGVSYPAFEMGDIRSHCSRYIFHPLYETFTYILIGMYLLVPTVIITASYCCAAKTLLKPNDTLERHSAGKVLSRQRHQRVRLAIAIIIIVAVFVSTWGLHFGLELVKINDAYLDECFQNFPVVAVLEIISRFLLRINSVINPIILCVVSTSHRFYTKKMLCCCLSKAK